jgi:hypothetical protein
MIAEPDEEDPTAKCWSYGGFDMNSIVNEFAKTEHDVVTFASSQGRQHPMTSRPHTIAHVAFAVVK